MILLGRRDKVNDIATRQKHTVGTATLRDSRLRNVRRPQRSRSSRTTLLEILRQAHEYLLRSSDRVTRTVAPSQAPARSSRPPTREFAPPTPGPSPSTAQTHRDAYPSVATQH